MERRGLAISELFQSQERPDEVDPWIVTFAALVALFTVTTLLVAGYSLSLEGAERIRGLGVGVLGLAAVPLCHRMLVMRVAAIGRAAAWRNDPDDPYAQPLPGPRTPTGGDGGAYAAAGRGSR